VLVLSHLVGVGSQIHVSLTEVVDPEALNISTPYPVYSSILVTLALVPMALLAFGRRVDLDPAP
jgi:hypothetical protein